MRQCLPRSYYTQQRDEVTRLIATEPGQWVLDVGCGEGGLGRVMKKKGCRIVGIEIESRAAAEAARHYDRVYTADVDSFELPFAPDSFDHIVCADVLEHLKDPWGMLTRFRGLLKTDGTLVASIPNIGNVETLSGLLRGRFDYTDWGILDRTHLRFFTRQSIEAMFHRAGYTIGEIRPKFDPNADRILDLWKQHDLGRRIRDLGILLGGTPFDPEDDDLRQMLVIQYLVIAGGNRDAVLGRSHGMAGRSEG